MDCVERVALCHRPWCFKLSFICVVFLS